MAAVSNVTAAEQQMINKFARLHQTLTQLKEDIKEETNNVQNIGEAADELLLLDSEDAAAVPFRIGQTFVHFDSDALGEKLEKLKEEAEGKITVMKKEASVIEAEMDGMKKVLYAKFGDRINLETDKDE